MNTRKILNGIKNYFNLQSDIDTNQDYNFIVESAAGAKKNVGQRIKNYFDLGFYPGFDSSAEKNVYKIMSLARDAGIKGSIEFPFARANFTFTEGDFKLKLKSNGEILVKCDAAFAEKIKTLPSVASVKAINTAAPAPKTDAPKL